MCIDFTDLDVVCPNNSYLSPNIDRLIRRSSNYKTLSFMDAYSAYNQIKMDPLDMPKTTFMSNHGNYYYNITPFGLKKAGVMYQRLISIVISKQIGQNMEVYISGMIVKTS